MRERRANSGNYRIQLYQDHAGLEPKHAIAQASELCVATRVSGMLETMMPTVHFHHEPRGGSGEIHDEASDAKLTAKAGAELAAVDALPERLLRWCERRTHLPCTKLEEGVAIVVVAATHGYLRDPEESGRASPLLAQVP